MKIGVRAILTLLVLSLVGCTSTSTNEEELERQRLDNMKAEVDDFIELHNVSKEVLIYSDDDSELISILIKPLTIDLQDTLIGNKVFFKAYVYDIYRDTDDSVYVIFNADSALVVAKIQERVLSQFKFFAPSSGASVYKNYLVIVDVDSISTNVISMFNEEDIDVNTDLKIIKGTCIAIKESEYSSQLYEFLTN